MRRKKRKKNAAMTRPCLEQSLRRWETAMNVQLASQRCFLCALVMTFCPGIVGSALADTITFRTVALTGDPAPGTPPDVDFSLFFRDPVIDGAGHSAFIARLTGPDVGDSNDDGIWTEGSGSLALLTREGDQAPGARLCGVLAS